MAEERALDAADGDVLRGAGGARQAAGADRAALPKGMDLNASVEQACHRQKIELYDAYARCMDKKKGDQAACNGWYNTYLSAWETCTTDLSLKVLETMAKEDPDPNMERLRR